MNKAFKKYGKTKFSSIIPRRLKVKRALRIARAAVASSQAELKVKSIMNSQLHYREKQIGIAKVLLSSAAIINKSLTRSDHPIQARKE